jgi:hypothetical protein
MEGKEIDLFTEQEEELNKELQALIVDTFSKGLN